MKPSAGVFGGLIHAKKRPKRSVVNNRPSSKPAKIEIRANVLEQIGAAAASVFDAFAGEGELYRGVWNRAGQYIGCDMKWYRDERVLYVTDSARIMRAIDLQKFNVFDFDAWGSPWEHVVVLCARRTVAPGERIGVVLTEGSGLKMKFGQLPHALAQLARVNPVLRGSSARSGHSKVIDRALNDMTRRLGCQMVKRWEARGKFGDNMFYIGLVLEGLPVAAQKKAAGAEAQAA